MSESVDPKTAAEWLEAATSAQVFLKIDSAWKYGLITPNPHVDVARCLWLLQGARARGIVPTETQIEAAIQAWARENALRSS